MECVMYNMYSLLMIVSNNYALPKINKRKTYSLASHHFPRGKRLGKIVLQQLPPLLGIHSVFTQYLLYFLWTFAWYYSGTWHYLLESFTPRHFHMPYWLAMSTILLRLRIFVLRLWPERMLDTPNCYLLGRRGWKVNFSCDVWWSEAKPRWIIARKRYIALLSRVMCYMLKAQKSFFMSTLAIFDPRKIWTCESIFLDFLRVPPTGLS